MKKLCLLIGALFCAGCQETQIREDIHGVSERVDRLGQAINETHGP